MNRQVDDDWSLSGSLERIMTSRQAVKEKEKDIKLFRPGLDNTRLFISLTAGAGTRCMSLLSSSPIL